MRRRTSRRFTCTLSAISQYMHIPASSALARQLNSVDDLRKREGLRICTGPLATQTARAFFPQHKVSTKYLNDLTGCAKDIEAGKADLIVNPLPSLEIGGVKGFKAVHTLIVAGTPLWVAMEGIDCPSDGNPRTEDQCFAVDHRRSAFRRDTHGPKDTDRTRSRRLPAAARSIWIPARTCRTST